MKQTRRFEEITLTEAERTAFLARVRAAVGAEDYRRIEGMSYALPEIIALIEQDAMTLHKLRHWLFGPKTEKTDRVCPPPTPPGSETETAQPQPKSKPKGHGRNKSQAYTGARRVRVAHPHLKAADPCPECQTGKVRILPTCGIILRLVGAPPLAATVWELEKLRCDTCGHVFTAPPPPEAGTQKYDPSVGATVALLRYGCGLPHYRLARLQQSLGVPMPESTQWEVMRPLRELARPVLEELITQAAHAPLIHQDDTTMRILDLRKPGSATAAQIDPERKGTFTTNLLAQVEHHPIALYFTGWQHAGENLAQVLDRRPAHLDPPIQMCDALARNQTPEVPTILAHCLSHGRREFVSLVESFPEECRRVLEAVREVYHADAQAKVLGLNPAQRLAHHQTHSQPVLAELQPWLREQMEGKKVEPNSGLGQAITYLLQHWEPLTLFVRQAGAPLDNNVCERALKMAILHRKNSLSYKTLNGAQTGDLFMSLIHTCRLNAVNPYEYLLALATHPQEVQLEPKAWLPWNHPKPAADTDTS